MLSKDKIISIFSLIDDILQGINHVEDIRRQVCDSEIILTAIVSSTGKTDAQHWFMKKMGAAGRQYVVKYFYYRILLPDLQRLSMKDLIFNKKRPWRTQEVGMK